MAESRAAAGASGSLSGIVRWPIKRIAGNIRVTVILSVVLICGSFAAAAALQMRNDRMHALAEASKFDELRANELALDLGAELNRYQAIGAAFAGAPESAETSAAIAESGGAALRNIAILDERGQMKSELTGALVDFLPLSSAMLDEARQGRAIAPAHDGKGFAIVFGVGQHIVAVELDARAMMPSAGEEAALLATLSGQVVALGSNWRALPSADVLALGGEQQASRVADMPDGQSLVALHRVAGWPLAVGASSPVGAALDAWYGALPLYLFVIFGPALAGAALAVVLVRAFERRARTTAAGNTLRTTRPDEAKLLVRLADAERRAANAERVQRQFMGHVSHELRTPLNAIIGFSEVIEQGVFGEHLKYAEYAHDIGSAGRELHGKIGDILDFADLEAARETLPSRAIDLVPVLQQVVAEMAPKAQNRGIRIAVALPASADAHANGAAFRRIAGNLIVNAIQYSPMGSTVRLQVKNSTEGIVVEVRDHGPGFSAEEIAQAGEPLRRFDRQGATTGLGMGLAVAAAFARRMGANLKLSSIRGEGTTAELRLPRA